MATTLVGGSEAALALTFVDASVTASAVTVGVGSTAADVATGSTALVRLVVVSNSFRAAAITIHDSGDSAGADGELPANGLSRNALTTRDIAVDAAAGADGCGFGVATVTSAVAVAGETVTLAAGALASATVGSWTVLVEAVASDRTVVAAVNAVFGVEARTVLLDCAKVSGFFFFFDL